MTTEADLIHLVYVSVATKPLAREELLALLAVARRINEPLGVTGILLYVDETFFQVLEVPHAKRHGHRIENLIRKRKIFGITFFKCELFL